MTVTFAAALVGCSGGPSTSAGDAPRREPVDLDNLVEPSDDAAAAPTDDLAASVARYADQLNHAIAAGDGSTVESAPPVPPPSHHPAATPPRIAPAPAQVEWLDAHPVVVAGVDAAPAVDESTTAAAGAANPSEPVAVEPADQADAAAVAELSEPASLRIAAIKLCKRVRGFGVYEPFEETAFLAGREHPVIVYAELEHFTTLKRGEEEYEVKLTQELTLYNDADGLAVWRQPAVEILDRSRKERRDFFVVQLVRLPARLSVGKYLLKSRVTDQHGNSLDESSLPVNIVADQSLVSGPRAVE